MSDSKQGDDGKDNASDSVAAEQITTAKAGLTPAQKLAAAELLRRQLAAQHSRANRGR